MLKYLLEDAYGVVGAVVALVAYDIGDEGEDEGYIAAAGSCRA